MSEFEQLEQVCRGSCCTKQIQDLGSCGRRLASTQAQRGHVNLFADASANLVLLCCSYLTMRTQTEKARLILQRRRLHIRGKLCRNAIQHRYSLI